ncbi:MAG: isoamylase early set domain-containing protein [Candidatus Omnitrophota bacterium]
MATKKQTTKKKRVTFELTAPSAKNVLIAGDFNSWDTNRSTLKKGRSGLWKTTATLDPGRYEYKFIVDGEWLTDPMNPDTTQNLYGGYNSVLTI